MVFGLIENYNSDCFNGEQKKNHREKKKKKLSSMTFKETEENTS